MDSPKASELVVSWIRRNRWFLISSGALFVPFYLLSRIVSQTYYLSDISATLLDKVFIIIATGRLESIGFLYPPLPFFLLLTGHSLWWLDVCSAGVAALLVTTVTHYMLRTTIDRRLLWPVLASIFFSPVLLRQEFSNLPNILGIIFLILALLNYRSYLEKAKIVHAFLSGIWLAGALLSTPSAVLWLFLFVVLTPFLISSRSLPEAFSASAVLAFPSLSVILTWIYLSWLFVGSLTFPYQLWFPQAGLSWLWMVPIYWTVAVLLIHSPKRLAIHLVPLVFLPLFPTLGFSDIGGTIIFLNVYALLNFPQQGLRPGRRWILLAGLLLQVAGSMYQMRHPLIPPASQQTLTEVAVSKALAKAAPASILTDDRQTYRIIAMAGTARPFLTPANTLYSTAELQPAQFCPYWLLGKDIHNPSMRKIQADDMVLDARFGQYRLYRRRSAPPLFTSYP